MDITKISKTLSYILRHKPEKFDIVLNKNGWAKVEDILDRLETDQSTLDIVVATNDKKRFSYSEDKSLIRANQGHTLDVDVELKKCVPPFKLYHGTKNNRVEQIMSTGLKPMKRQHVHISVDIDTAMRVAGRRSGDDILLEISSRRMYADKIDIFISENGVYLVSYVDPKYIKIVE